MTTKDWHIGTDVDVFSIALHETGHALGSAIPINPGDVMYPYYSQHTGLAQNDISAILQIYAAQDGTPNPTQLRQRRRLKIHWYSWCKAPPSSTTAASVAISGTISGGAGTVQVSWSTNQGAAGVAQGSSPWTIAAVPLSIGLNVINVQASDSQQNRASQNLIVTRQQVLPIIRSQLLRQLRRRLQRQLQRQLRRPGPIRRLLRSPFCLRPEQYFHLGQLARCQRHGQR